MNRTSWIDAAIWTANGVLALAACYVGWAYWSAHALGRALENRDAAALSRKVDWPTLRSNLKANLAAEMLEQTTKAATATDPTDKAAMGMATLMGPAVVNGLIDSYVTPQGLAFAFSNAGSSPAPGLGSRVDHVGRAGLVAADRFEIELKGAEGDGVSAVAVLELIGFRWKLTDLRPVKPLSSFAQADRLPDIMTGSVSAAGPKR